MRFTLLFGMLGSVNGHASVIMPPSRNAVDGEPGTPWSNGKHPPTGSIMPYDATCTNGTSMCNSGQVRATETEAANCPVRSLG